MRAAGRNPWRPRGHPHLDRMPCKPREGTTHLVFFWRFAGLLQAADALPHEDPSVLLEARGSPPNHAGGSANSAIRGKTMPPSCIPCPRSADEVRVEPVCSQGCTWRALC